MPASPPSISVIVVCRNPGARLRTALESVWAQTFLPELVVIDGASTDGSREWLESQRPRIAALVSEPDAGIYPAMNKGLAATTADWVLFLGADDRLATPTTLAEAANSLATTDASVASGEARFDDGRLYSFGGIHTAIRRNFVHHQATFYRRALFTRHGSFDSSLRIQADYEFNLRLLRRRERFARLALRVADCASGGLSDSGRLQNYREEIVARHRHFAAVRCLPWDALSVARFIRKQILKRLRRA